MPARVKSLTSTSYVILGVLAKGPRSGYDIKTLADRSVRFFWNLSYSQIYPELKNLTDLGLVEPESADRGDRHRTLYRITPSGVEALHEWLVDAASAPLELRDEMLLKLFFADAMSPQERLEHVRAMRRREQEIVRTLRQIEPLASSPQSPPCRLHVLQAGIGLHRYYDEFLAGLEKELAAEVGDHA